MSKKVHLEVREESNYGKALSFMRENRIYTKSQLVEFFMDKLGRNEKQAISSVAVMLSPREESKTGNCRGNMSCRWGHLAYNEKLKRKIDKETGKKLEQEFRFRYRTEAMSRLVRKKKLMVGQEKESVKTTKVKTKAKTKERA